MAEEVAKLISKVLAAADLTQGQLGGKIGVSQGTISKWLSGVHSPNSREWTALIEFAASNPATRSLAFQMVLTSFDLDPATRRAMMALYESSSTQAR